jgi:hypothetical protein
MFSLSISDTDDVDMDEDLAVFVRFPEPKLETKFIPTYHKQSSILLLARGFSASSCYLLNPTVNVGSVKLFTNKDFLELHYTSKNFESRNFTVVGTDSQFEYSKSYEILTQWLYKFAGVFDKSAKSVHAKAQKVDQQYLKLLKCLRSRSNVKNVSTLCDFLHQRFDWHMKLKLPLTDIIAVPVVSVPDPPSEIHDQVSSFVRSCMGSVSTVVYTGTVP